MIEVIVALLGAAAVIGGAVIVNICNNKNIEKKVDVIVEHQKENYLGILRLTVMSEEMPTSERIIAGSKYLKAGGNGDVKKFYQEFLATHTTNK